MTFRTLIRRSLWFHWRAHLGVVLGAAVGSAALIGALVVGDSVRESLKQLATGRMGKVEYAMATGDRTLTDQLLNSIREEDGTRTTNGLFVFFAPTNWAAGGLRPAGLLSVWTVLARDDGAARANRVHVFGDLRIVQPVYDMPGIVKSFWRFASRRVTEDGVPSGEIWLNEALAKQLRVSPGDTVLVRVEKPQHVSSEIAIAPRNDPSKVLRLRVTKILRPGQLGNFSLTANPQVPLNAFVNLEQLQNVLSMKGRFNLIVTAGVSERTPASPMQWVKVKVIDLLIRFHRSDLASRMAPSLARPTSTARALAFYTDRLKEAWRLDDLESKLTTVPDSSLQLVTTRVFLDLPLIRAALAADTNAQPVLTYLANLLRAGTNATPYSMVTAAGPPWTPTDLRDDEILVSQWLAEDLQVKPGDSIELSYFLPESGAKLTEAANTFRVRAVVPMEMPWADRMLMPDFPGIEKAESTRDWDAGFPLVHKIRPKDEDYWKQNRGTPKAFITLAAGQKMWANRFGNLTAIRFPIPTNTAGPLTPSLSPGGGEGARRAGEGVAAGTTEVDGAHGVTRPADAEAYRAALEKKILATLKPEELGLRFEPVREQALKAAEQSQDFGQLFLGFSFFLIVAALLLMALLFQFGLEQRMAEIGTLLALGFGPKQVRRLLLGEGVALAFVGGVLGTFGGIAFARAMLHGLTTVWRDAVGASALSFHFTAQTLVIGLFASVVVCAATIWLTLRKFVRRPARELLAGEVQSPESRVQSRGRAIGIVALALAAGVVGWPLARGDTANAGAFFGAGALLLLAGLGFVSAWMKKLEHGREAVAARGRGKLTLGGLGLRGCARRRKRSLATVAMLACGSFLIVAIGVFRLDANRDATRHASGTGGFALIGEMTMPVVQDLNAKSGRDSFALAESDLTGVNFVPLRVHDGDEASCLNLNRAQTPRLLGVKPEMLEGRFTFAKAAKGFDSSKGWSILRSSRHEKALVNSEVRSPKSETNQSLLTSAATNVNEIAAIGDANSIEWALHKKVGDTIDFTDERGQPFKVRIVGTVANSILQGSLIIDEAEFVKRFPSESGYRMFLIDAPTNAVPQVSAALSRAMQDVGLELTPAAQRLAQFNAVQNTYLGTFQVLGGLGLLLGSVGLGIVVLRNVLERRGELALLLAVGFRAPVLQRLLLVEHGALLGLGLAIGILAAAVAVLPALLAPGAQLPYASLGLTLAAVLANGAAWTWAATRFALRGNLLAALRNE